MYPLFQKVTNLETQVEVLRSRAYGVIEVANHELVAVHLRPWPKLISKPQVRWDNDWFHRRSSGDRCWVYYNQPFSCKNFLAVSYTISTSETTLATLRTCIDALEEIARIKRTDAIVCEASNLRISDRLLKRWGWESHCPHRRGRHFIKRFYGQYPSKTREEKQVCEPVHT